MKEMWKSKSLPMKIVFIIRMILSVIVFVCAFLGLTGICNNLDMIYMPGLSLILFIQGIEYWKQNRPTAIFSIIVGIFIFISVLLKFVRS